MGKNNNFAITKKQASVELIDMAKKLFFPLIIVLLLVNCKGNNIQIKGNLTNPIQGEYIFIEELMSDLLVPVDSTPINADGSFSFSLDIERPSFFLLKFDNSNYLTMLLEPGQDIEITAQNDNLNFPTSITGTPGTTKMIAYNERLMETIDQISGLSKIYGANLQNPRLYAIMDSLDYLAQGYMSDINKFTKEYIDDNLSSLVSVIALYQQIAPGEYVLHPEKDLNYYIKVDSALFPKYPDYDPVATLHEQVQEVVSQLSTTAVNSPESLLGKILLEITLPNPNGEMVSLSSTRGKVVLVDFWASWCPPCREESPNLVKAYRKYKNSGFEIFQVSLDKTKDAWIKGITDDKLDQWIHVSDLKYWNSVVVEDFHLEAIPANFLLDGEGKVIAINLRGDELENKLGEIFK